MEKKLIKVVAEQYNLLLDARHMLYNAYRYWPEDTHIDADEVKEVLENLNDYLK